MATETVAVRLDETWKPLSLDNSGPFSADVVGFRDALFFIGDSMPADGTYTGLRQRSIAPTTFGTVKVYARAVEGTTRVNVTRLVNAGNVSTPVFQTLGLSASALSTAAPAGTAIGTLTNRLAGSTTRLLTNTNIFALSSDGSTLVAGLIPAEPGKKFVTVRESHPDAGNNDTTLEVTVSAPALAISGSNVNATEGQDFNWSPLVTGGYGRRSFRLIGSLPTGWSMSSTTGAVYAPGGFISASMAPVSGFSIVVRDEAGNRAQLDGITLTPVAGGGPVGVANLFGSSRLRFPDRATTLNTGSSFLSAAFVVPAMSPALRRGKNPRVFIPGFFCNNSGASDTERQVPNQFKAAYWLEVGGIRRRAKFGGQAFTTRGGAGSLYGSSLQFDIGILSDPIKNADGSDFFIERGTALKHISEIVLNAVGDLFPGSQYLTASLGSVCRNSTDGTGATLETLIEGGGAIATSGSSPTMQFAPAYMVMEDADTGELFSFLIPGDSRDYGVGDFTTGTPASQPANALQGAQRAMVSIGLPHGVVAIPGSTPTSPNAHRYAALDEAQKVYGGRRPWTHTLSNHGNNGSLTANVAGCVTEREGLRTLSGPGVKHGKLTIPPRIGTGGDYRTLAGQTPAAADTYPSGDRAVLNNSFLINAPDANGMKWDFVIDAGLYGSAAYGKPKTDSDWNDARSKFSFGPSSTLAAAWSNANTIRLSSNVFAIGDVLAAGSTFTRANIMGPIVAGPVDNGDGTFTYTFETGGYAGSYAQGDPIARVATTDGTHDAPWNATLQSLAIIQWFNNGRPALYPAA